MPYASNATLPPAVKKLDPRLQTAFRKAFNSAYDTYKGDEQKAFATAWATVNKMKENQSSFHPSFLRVLDLYLSRYGRELGEDKFSYFLVRNGLDPSKSYDPHTQFNESFTWAEPYIRFMKEDKQAKYYAVRALHAIISLNNNDYTDWGDMERAAMSMNYRPLNYNHDHDRWIPYPRTRVEYAKAEDMCVELILRVDNQDAYLQKQLDHDPSIPEKEWINHPSIEGRPMLGGAEKGYHFTALAMLEKGYHIPGDPLSEIFPIMMEGVQGGEVCLMVNGEKVCLECDAALKEGTDMNENEGEINQGGAVCSNCGLIVNLDGIADPSEVDCPNCGADMTSRPEKTVETANNLNNTESDSKTMSDNSVEDISTPVVPENTGTEPSASELKTENARLNAELSNKIAEVIELTNALRQTTIEKTQNENRLRSDNMEMSTQLASKTREVGILTSYKNRTAEQDAELAKKEATIGGLEAEIEEKNTVITRKDSRHQGLSKELVSLKEDFEKLKVQMDNVRNERNDLSVKARMSEEKALNETRERSRIELDNADLLDKLRENTAEISKLSERLALGANQKLQLEKTNSQLEEVARKAAETHRDKLAEAVQTIEKAKKFHTWAWQQLKEAGVAVLQSEG